MKGLHGIIFSYEKRDGPAGAYRQPHHTAPSPLAATTGSSTSCSPAWSTPVSRDVGVIMHGKCQSHAGSSGLRQELGSQPQPRRPDAAARLCLQRSAATATGSSAAGWKRCAGVMNYLKGIRQDYVRAVGQRHWSSTYRWRTCCARHIDTRRGHHGGVHRRSRATWQDTYFHGWTTPGASPTRPTRLRTPSGYRCLNMFVLRHGAAAADGDGVRQPQSDTASAAEHIAGDGESPAAVRAMCTTATPPASAHRRATTTAAWSCWTPACADGCSARSARCMARRTTRPPATSTRRAAA